MPHRSRRFLATLASAVVFGYCGLSIGDAQAQDNQQRTTSAAPTNVELRKGEVLFNFQRADIEAVVKTVSQMTGRNFILDPRVKGKVTIISASPVSKAAAYQIFVSAIKAQGFTTVSAPGGTIKIVPVAEGKQNADYNASARPAPVEQIITHVVIVQHGEATQLVPLLRPLMAPTSQLSAYAGANALIITDYADNVRRLLTIIEQVDQPSSSEVTVIPLENASALDIAELVSRLSSGQILPVRAVAQQQAAPQGQIGGERFSVVPDLRTNSLLVRTDNPGRLLQLRSLIAKLDVPARAGGQTRVIYLKNADAVQLAELLRGLLSGEAGLATPVRGTTAPAAATAAKGVAAGSLVQADEATNSLIIQAPDGIYNNLRAVIEKLDIRRAQVFVETLIAAIRTDLLRDLGLQWVAAGSAGDTGIVGINNSTQGRSIVGTILDPTGTLVNAAGLTLAFLGGETTLPDGTKVRSLAGLAHALDQKGYGTILSTPNILTMDNAEAKITVAQNVPFVTGSFAQASGVGSTVNPFQTIERQDVGIVLKVKPQISEGNVIKLEVFQEVSNVDPTPVGGASDITTQKRTVQTTVLVDNGNTVVLGGLLDEQFNQDEQGITGLSSLPVIGGLFRTRKKTRSKANLMVFLRPSIIRRAEDTVDITRDRYTGVLDDKRSINPGPSQVLDSFSAGAVVRYPAHESDYEKTESSKPAQSELLGPPDVEENVPGVPVKPES
jgi:general secretion pathway protein D